jgi:hypothetical protein
MPELSELQLPEFQRYQFAFTSHIRDPRQAKRPAGVEARRMKIYNELLYNNLESFLLACFPVLRKVLGKRRWNRLVRAFISGHRSHTPYFRQIPDEFLQFLQNEWEMGEDYPEYMLELAHYEWIELVLSVSNRDEQLAEHDTNGDLIEGWPLLNPVLANLAYQYPVHRIRPRVKVAAAPAFLLVFRDAEYNIRFIEQSNVSARLLKLLEPGKLTGREAVTRLSDEIGHGNPSQLVDFARGFLEELRHAGAVLGTASQPQT